MLLAEQFVRTNGKEHMDNFKSICKWCAHILI